MMKLKHAGLMIVATGALLGSLGSGVARACAMCGLSPGDHAIHAFNTSVIFMLAGPYLTMAAIGGVIFVAWRKANGKERSAQKR